MVPDYKILVVGLKVTMKTREVRKISAEAYEEVSEVQKCPLLLFYKNFSPVIWVRPFHLSDFPSKIDQPFSCIIKGYVACNLFIHSSGSPPRIIQTVMRHASPNLFWSQDSFNNRHECFRVIVSVRNLLKRISCPFHLFRLIVILVFYWLLIVSYFILKDR